MRPHNFVIGVAGGARWRWHAVDLTVLGPRYDAAAAEGRNREQVEVYSVCGLRCTLGQRLGPFAYGSSLLASRRCERCGWVVAFNHGTVEQEIDEYTPHLAERELIAAAGADPDLLRHIFTAILADAPPGRDDEPGHRSDLLAHAARHRPVVTVCEECDQTPNPATVHGLDVTVCPHATVVCGACTFTAGPWAMQWEGKTTGECVVSAPCSAMTALAQHYEVLADHPVTHNSQWGVA
jgi:hypothetical protein